MVSFESGKWVLHLAKRKSPASASNDEGPALKKAKKTHNHEVTVGSSLASSMNIINSTEEVLSGTSYPDWSTSAPLLGLPFPGYPTFS
ncbi:MAG: hypothetical protein H0W88_11110 [Parachlamydiaceae bacterium]|nr:hypothetical protein [Parachlamydiaceae bacterium]